MAVVEGPLFGDFVDVARGVVVVDQDQVAFALLGLVHIGAAVAQQLHELTVAVDAGRKLLQPAQQGTGLVAVAGIEGADLGFQKVGEVEGGAGGGLGGRAGVCKAPTLCGLVPGHHSPTDRLGIGEDARLNGFVLAGAGHLRIPIGGCHGAHSRSDSAHSLLGIQPGWPSASAGGILEQAVQDLAVSDELLGQDRRFRNSGAKSAPFGQQTVHSSGST